jgi:hypothetical protein
LHYLSIDGWQAENGSAETFPEFTSFKSLKRNFSPIGEQSRCVISRSFVVRSGQELLKGLLG